MTNAQPIIDDGVRADYAPNLYRYDTEAQQVARFTDIGPEQLAFFHQQGYLVIAEAFFSCPKSPTLPTQCTI